MIVLMLGLIVLALLANMFYYENMYKKPVYKKDPDLMKAYLDISRRKRGSQG